VPPAPVRISAVVAAHDQAREVDRLLDHLCDLDGLDDIVLVDGGSRDGTGALARAHAARAVVLDHDGSHAARLNAGAQATAGDVVVFVPVEARLPRRAAAALRAACRDAHVVGGDFALSFDGGDGIAKALGLLYAANRRLGWWYGDSVLWCRRSAFDALGGFRDGAAPWDHDFTRRLQRLGQTRCLPGPATTPSRRWRALGIPRTLCTGREPTNLALRNCAPGRRSRA